MTLPEQDGSTSPPCLNLNVPIVHSLSSTALQNLGWEKKTEEVTITKKITFYTLKDKRVDYDGAVWRVNGSPVQFVEDL